MSIKVKALEWQDSALVVFDNWLTVRIADTPFGQYRVDKMDRHRFRVTFGVAIIDAHSSLQDALAGAQADYERRILSALAPSPSMRESDGWGIDEREDDAIIFCTNWQGGRTALARRPKLMTNAAWRPIAEDIIVALAAARSLTGAKP